MALVSLRADPEAVQGVEHRALWEGPALELPTDGAGREVRAQIQITDAGLKVRAGTTRVVITAPDGTETHLTPGDGALAPEGATIRAGNVALRIEAASVSLKTP